MKRRKRKKRASKTCIYDRLSVFLVVVYKECSVDFRALQVEGGAKVMEVTRETWLDKPQWSQIRRSPDFAEICGRFGTGLSMPKYEVLFACGFPEHAYRTLDKILGEMSSSSHYFARMMKTKGDSERLKLCCEAIALISAASDMYSRFFLSFDCMSPLFRVLEVDHGEASLLALTAITHIVETCAPIAETVLTDAMVSKLFGAFDNARECKWKKSYMFTLSSVAVHVKSRDVISKLCMLFKCHVENRQLFPIAVRGLSNISNNWPQCIIDCNIVQGLLQSMTPENDLVIVLIVNILMNLLKFQPNAVTEHVDPPSLQRIAIVLLDREPCHYTIHLIRFITELCCKDPSLAQSMLDPSFLVIISKLLTLAGIDVKSATFCLVITMLELSHAVPTPEICAEMIDALDMVPHAMAARASNVLVPMFQAISPNDDVIHSFMEAVHSLDASYDEQLSVAVANATSAFD